MMGTQRRALWPSLRVLEFHLLSSWFGPRKFASFLSPSACLHFLWAGRAVSSRKRTFSARHKYLRGVGQELTVPPAWSGASH